jgi:hypothetical protein
MAEDDPDPVGDAAPVEPAPVAPRVPTGTTMVWVEDDHGGPPYAFEVAEIIYPRTPQFAYQGATFMHCADRPDGQWIYRRLTR